jgi:hypothetical protein
LDWRSDLLNHERFEPVLSPSRDNLVEPALRVARWLGLGFTTQDWIEDDDGVLYFLEANPNGQWLFVDQVLEGAVTQAVVESLERLSEEA